jgi:hypothetical protein
MASVRVCDRCNVLESVVGEKQFVQSGRVFPDPTNGEFDVHVIVVRPEGDKKVDGDLCVECLCDVIRGNPTVTRKQQPLAYPPGMRGAIDA